MKISTKIMLAVLAVVLVCAGFVIGMMLKPEPKQVAIEEVAAPAAPIVAVDKNKPATHYPITPTASEQASADPLPALAVSDTSVRNALANLLSEKTVAQFFYPTEIIRRLVVTIDNLPRDNVAAQLLPLKPVAGQFLVAEKDKTLFLDPANYQRYTPLVELVQNLDSKKLVAVYKYFYPLFQEQYRSLGYPDGYFNDRLVVVIDAMINFSESNEAPQLIQKHVLYQYANEDMEKMSAGGKMLTRMGHDNAQKVKSKLREIRSELIK